MILNLFTYYGKCASAFEFGVSFSSDVDEELNDFLVHNMQKGVNTKPPPAAIDRRN